MTEQIRILVVDDDEAIRAVRGVGYMFVPG